MRKRVLIPAAAACLVFILSGCQQRSPDERMQKAVELFQQRDTLGATLEARELIKKFPEDPRALEAHMLLAQIHLAEQRPDEALAELQTVLSKISQNDPRGREALRQYLGALQRQRRFDEALKTIDRYQKEYADDEATSLNFTVARGDILTAAGETTAARNIFLELYEVTTEPAVLQFYRDMIARTYVQEGSLQNAIAFFEEELGKATDEEMRRDLMMAISLWHAQDENYEAARQWAERVTRTFESAIREEIDPNVRSGLALQLAQFYSQVGNLPGASDLLFRLYEVIEDESLMVQIINGLSQTLFREGRTSDALAMLNDAAQRFPESGLEAQVAQIETLHRQNLLEERAPPDTSTLALRFKADPPLTLEVPIREGDAPTTRTARQADIATTGAMEGDRPTTPGDPEPAMPEEVGAFDSGTTGAQTPPPAAP